MKLTLKLIGVLFLMLFVAAVVMYFYIKSQMKSTQEVVYEKFYESGQIQSKKIRGYDWGEGNYEETTFYDSSGAIVLELGHRDYHKFREEFSFFADKTLKESSLYRWGWLDSIPVESDILNQIISDSSLDNIKRLDSVFLMFRKNCDFTSFSFDHLVKGSNTDTLIHSSFRLSKDDFDWCAPSNSNERIVYKFFENKLSGKDTLQTVRLD
jgi:hypothetical protein